MVRGDITGGDEIRSAINQTAQHHIGEGTQPVCAGGAGLLWITAGHFLH